MNVSTSGLTVRKKEAKSILTKSPIHGNFTANPYAGCEHNCLYCYAKYLPEWTGHEGERWGEYIDVKYWNPLTEKQKKNLNGKSVFISSATDPYQDVEAEFKRTHALLEELRGTGARVQIVTKSCNVVWDADILKDLDATVSFSVNTLDEEFRKDMDNASSIEMRLEAMKYLHDRGIRTVCFISPIFPGITDAPAIIKKVDSICDEIYLEHLVLQNPYKGSVLYYIRTKYPDLYEYYDRLFNQGDLTEWWEYDDYMEEWCKENGYEYAYDHLPREKRDKPVVINFKGHKGK